MISRKLEAYATCSANGAYLILQDKAATHMRDAENTRQIADLDHLLAMIEEHVDLDHCREVDRRYRATLACEPVDRPPLVVRLPFAARLQLPAPWDAFTVYPHRQAYNDPAAMMQNQLLGSVVPGMLLEDDHPLLIRADHGTIQIASLLGARWEQADDNPPWVYSLGSPEAIAAVAEGRTPLDLDNGGVLARSFATLRFFHDKLAAYPRARQAIQIAMPDLQGPLDTADQLWGCGLFAAFYEEPELVDKLLGRIVDVMFQVADRFRVFATDRLDPFANAQHAWQVPGRLLIRNDSAIMLSPQMYAEQVRPHDQRLLLAVGGGSQHFCGNGQHLIQPMLDTDGMRGFDFGQPWLMDEDRVYAQTVARHVPFTNHRPPREELLNGRARRRFPTGVVFTYEPRDFDDAREVVKTSRQI